MAIYCGVTVKIFSIGFWKPYLKFTWKNIEWRITPWLLGGYVSLAGETTEEPNGLMVQKYGKKSLVICAGVVMNLCVALVCYWINYRNILIGMYIDWLAIVSTFTNDYGKLIHFVIYFKPNLILLQLSMINLFCFIVNLCPLWPGLDGSYLWLYLMRPIWKDEYIKYLQLSTKFGFWSLMILQGVFLVWMFLK